MSSWELFQDFEINSSIRSKHDPGCPLVPLERRAESYATDWNSDGSKRKEEESGQHESGQHESANQRNRGKNVQRQCYSKEEPTLQNPNSTLF